VIVSGLSFEVRAGTALVLRGPNGSGKTTLLRTIAGFIPPARGGVRIVASASSVESRPPHPDPLPQARLGELANQSGSIRRRMLRGSIGTSLPKESSGVPSALGEKDRMRGDSSQLGADLDGVFHYIGHANGVKPRLSVIENLIFWQRYYAGAQNPESAEAALEAFDLLSLADYSAAHLSQGQARRLGLARLLAAGRPIWLLDEPSVSLDSASTRLLEGAIARHLAAGGLAIISTHADLSLADAVLLDLGSAPPPQ
jgi:heme ABC exporter ATP-binding subunit CcmA